MKRLYSFFALMLLTALSFTTKAATATVYIDKPNAVMFYVYDGDWNQIELANAGDTPNIIEFNEAKTKLFEFDPYNLNTGIYKISLNGEDIDMTANFNGEGYEVPGVKDGDVIRVQVERPATELCSFTMQGTIKAIASVENADTEEFYEVEDGAFKAKFGDRVVLRPSKEYDVQSVTLNGEETTYIPASGCYFFVVNANENVIVVTASPATGINAAVATQSAKTYNINGTQAGKKQKGLVILNGKKICL